MKRLFTVLLIALAAALAACGSEPQLTTSPSLPSLEIELKATDIVYDMNRIEVLAGQPVKLTLHNEGALEHDFSILEMPHMGEVMLEEMEDEMAGHDMGHMSEDLEIHVAAPMGGRGVIEFTPSEPGEYEFFCTVVGHKEAGMVGTLVVKAP